RRAGGADPHLRSRGPGARSRGAQVGGVRGELRSRTGRRGPVRGQGDRPDARRPGANPPADPLFAALQGRLPRPLFPLRQGSQRRRLRLRPRRNGPALGGPEGHPAGKEGEVRWVSRRSEPAARSATSGGPTGRRPRPTSAPAPTAASPRLPPPPVPRAASIAASKIKPPPRI